MLKLNLCDLMLNKCNIIDNKNDLNELNIAVNNILKSLNDIVNKHSIGVAQINWLNIVESMFLWITNGNVDWIPVTMIANYI